MTSHTLQHHAQALLTKASAPYTQVLQASRICLLPYQVHSITQSQWLAQSDQLPRANIQHAQPKRQASYYYGRLCAHQALSQLNCQTKVHMGMYNEPIWPKGFMGSITHTHEMAGAIASSHPLIKGIGIDIENILQSCDANIVFNSVLTKKEAASFETEFRHTSQLSHAHLLTTIFSIKESFYKAAFNQVKRILEFDAIEIIHISEDRAQYRINDHDTCKALNISPEMTLTAHYQIMGKCVITILILMK